MTFVVPVAVTLTAVGVASELTQHPATTIEATAGILIALGVIWRKTHITEAFRTFRSLADLAPAVKDFLLDWKGQPARDGVDAIPSFPARMKANEDRLDSLHAKMDGFDAALTALAADLARIEAAASGNSDALARVETRANGIDQRITDHRNRNDETAEQLRKALEKRARDLDLRLKAQADEISAALEARNSTVDARLASLSEDLLRAETMRAALAELGIPLGRPEKT